MADIVYTKFLEKLNQKLLDLDSDDIKCVLLTSSYTPNKDHDFYSDLTNEVVGTGYTAGGASLANTAVTSSDTSDTAWFDSDDVLWTTATITARYAVLYDNTRTEKDLITCYDFGSDKSSTGGDFKVIPDATFGWYKIAQG